MSGEISDGKNNNESIRGSIAPIGRNVNFPEQSKKPSNPKDLIGITKAPASTIPRGVIAEVGVAMLEGALKYGRHNYRAIGVRSSIYFDAACGHLDSWWEGEDIDEDSGLSHITKAIASLVVLRDAMLQDMLNDDRPPQAMTPNMRKALSATVTSMLEKYPEPVAPFIMIKGEIK